MILSGSNKHSLAEQREVSFILNGSFDSQTGLAAFGFSGENKTFNFNFKSGKVYDPEGRFFDTYNEHNSSSLFPVDDNLGKYALSGNLSETSYDYYNKHGFLSCSVGQKENFKVNNIYFNTTGCEFNGDIFVYGKPIKIDVEATSNFGVGGNWKAKIKNKDNDRSFKIFNVKATSDHGLFGKKETYSGEQVVNEKSLLFQHTGTIGAHNIKLEVDTDFGKIEESFFSLATNQFSYFTYAFDTETNLNNLSGSGLNDEKNVYFSYWSALLAGSGSSSVAASNRDINVTLQHSGGNTGMFFGVTGANVTYSGNNYTDTPSVIFTGGSPVITPLGYSLKATAEASIDNGKLSLITIADSGMYDVAGGLPGILISGGGDLAVTGSGAAFTGERFKPYTGYWDIAISSGLSSYTSFLSAGYFVPSLSGYSRTYTISKDVPSVSFRVTYKNLDEDKMISKLRISGYNNTEETTFLTGSISGSKFY